MANAFLRARSPTPPQPPRQRCLFWLYVSYALVILIFFIVYVLISNPGAPLIDYQEPDYDGTPIEALTNKATIELLKTDEVLGTPSVKASEASVVHGHSRMSQVIPDVNKKSEDENYEK